jgi:hypothetical protein
MKFRVNFHSLLHIIWTYNNQIILKAIFDILAKMTETFHEMKDPKLRIPFSNNPSQDSGIIRKFFFASINIYDFDE